MKKLFVAATRQNDGKSTLCLGLLQALRKTFPEIGFMKPVGQHYIKRGGYEIDEDVSLMKDVCRVKDNLADMNPIVVKKGFTEEYIQRGDKKELIQKIQGAFKRISENKELIQRALQKLDSNFRSVLVLRLIDGYSTTETAQILKLPKIGRAHV